jgi:PhnB protein
MNPLLKFDFTVNKENNTIHVEREFNSDLNLVWEAWTNPEILDQWWAPKPYQTKTKTMDFRNGGLWIYCMISPQNETHWCKADYKEVAPMKSYSYVDNFCDENGTISHPFPNSFWTNHFSETGEITTVNITIQYESLEALEKIIEVGFKEGFTMAMENLDLYIESKF